MVIQIIAGIFLLYIGAEVLVRGSAELARRAGVPAIVVGLTIVAFGTSSPELFVSIKASLMNQGDISIGNIVGSNICNIGLILGLSAIVRPLRVRTQIIKTEIPFMILASLMLILVLLNRTLSRYEGGILFTGFILYILWMIRRVHREIGEKFKNITSEAVHKKTKPTWLNVIFIIFGLVILVAGSSFLVRGAIQAGIRLGISTSLIGLTIVAVGTSLPELATSVVASWKNQNDIAVGNIIGSNLFNILCILGLAGIIAPVTIHDIQFIDLIIMFAFSILILPLSRSGFVINRLEGFFLILLYGVYLYFRSMNG